MPHVTCHASVFLFVLILLPVDVLSRASPQASDQTTHGQSQQQPHQQATGSSITQEPPLEKAFQTSHESASAHVAEIIDTLLNSEKIIFNSEEAGKLIPVTSTADVQVSPDQETIPPPINSSESKNKFQYIELPLTTTTSELVNETTTQPSRPLENGADLDAASSDLVSESTNTASISKMNDTFYEIFNRPRSDAYSSSLKEKSRELILARFKEFGLETNVQAFTANKNGIQYKGKNLIAILPGKYRNVKGKDTIVLAGAHYDTVRTSPGVDDNGSGMVAILEVARILSSGPQLNHSVMFVAFDLEENGLIGSMAFTKEYLIPRELLDGQTKFLGAYIIDMALNYESSENSQRIPSDMAEACPSVTAKIAMDGNRGDFIAVWMRKNVDGSVFDPILNEWSGHPKYKLRAFDPPLPAEPSKIELTRYSTFTRSDHASFWYHKHPNYKQTLPSILLTDMGPWRGYVGERCYHNTCDDLNYLTAKNLKFLKNTVDVMTRVMSTRPPILVDQETNSSVPPLVPPLITSGSRGNGRGPIPRGHRGRNNPMIPRMPQWPRFPSNMNIPSWALTV